MNTQPLSTERIWLAVAASMVGFLAILVSPEIATAQDWKVPLEAERAKNAERIAEIDKTAAPILVEYQAVQAQIAVHNAQTCTVTEDQPNGCDAYNAEAAAQNEKSDGFMAQLKALAAEQEGLIARNQEIDIRLKCVQLPISCSKNDDCTCSKCCGTWDGNQGTGTCQPSCTK